MSIFPVGSNVCGVISCNLNKKEIAEAYSLSGWGSRRCTWVDYEVWNDFADLRIEGDGEIRIRGPVANPSANIDRIVEPLRKRCDDWSLELYDEDGRLLGRHQSREMARV